MPEVILCTQIHCLCFMTRDLRRGYTLSRTLRLYDKNGGQVAIETVAGQLVSLKCPKCIT